MSDSIRTFVAVEPPAGLRAALAGVPAAASLPQGAPLRWTPPENLHLTLRFLGDTPEEQLAPLADALGAIAAGAASFELELGGAGAYPDARAARVLWVGLVDADRKLRRLRNEVEAAVRGLGWKREGRRFQPHLTLARLRRPTRLPAGGWIETVPRCRFAVEEVSLIRSTLKPAGAEYDVLHRAPLAG
ncbi:MAG: RNA 2',3'-cyclic phosphodiesterase [Gemmatimonadetes bacterium]|nr:RNA 2',3'-cyclic phosphodiesterase [Gemmatimonadota bacterium]